MTSATIRKISIFLLLAFSIFGLENRVWGFFAEPVPGVGQIGAQTSIGIGENVANFGYDASGYTVAPNTGPKRILSADVLSKTDKFHNFPSHFDDAILKTKPEVIENFFKKSKPGLSNTTKRFRLHGQVEVDGTTRTGTFEIFTRPSTSGRNEVITHRFFNPD